MDDTILKKFLTKVARERHFMKETSRLSSLSPSNSCFLVKLNRDLRAAKENFFKAAREYWMAKSDKISDEDKSWEKLETLSTIYDNLDKEMEKIQKRYLEKFPDTNPEKFQEAVFQQLNDFVDQLKESLKDYIN